MEDISKAEQEKYFNICNMKNPQVEVMLSSDKEDQITEGTTHTLERFSRIPNKMQDNELRRLKITEKKGNHSNILVKNKYIPKGWSVFEPNSIKHKTFTIVNDKGKDITKQYFTVSPQNYTINPEPTKDAHNPGYCGMFGIIFMVYFRMHKDDPEWFKNWTKFIEAGLVNVKLAANVQKIIATNIISKIEGEIQELLNERLILKPSASPSASKSASAMSRASTRSGLSALGASLSASNASLSATGARASRSGVKRKRLETIEEENSVRRSGRSVRTKIEGGGKKGVTKRVRRKTRTRRRRASYKRSKL